MNSLSSGSALLSHGVLRVTDSRGSSGSGRDYFRPLAPGAVPDGQRCNLSAESPKQCNAADRQTTRHRNRVSSLDMNGKLDLKEGLDTNLIYDILECIHSVESIMVNSHVDIMYSKLSSKLFYSVYVGGTLQILLNSNTDDLPLT